ncbi:MAG: biosynthetic arginine decarboxylase [Chitinivibrionales bacterium]|nr:biosynthetic arginine decarboxylase [Chitinivibrionales bacterium]
MANSPSTPNVRQNHVRQEDWTAENSAELYGIYNWGAGYFDISANGDVVVTIPNKRDKISISLMSIVQGLKERGLDMPVLLRVKDLLNSQISILHTSFNKAIKQFNYQSIYKGVYPIKVNQQRQVVEEIANFGANFHHGLEAGSKAELIAAISMLKDLESCLICNGYKDKEFIDLGLYATKLGYKCFFVVEMMSELCMIVDRAKVLGIKPCIGIRIKLSTRAGGYWTESSGERSLFGLTTTEIIEAIDYLKKNAMLDSLQLLHYHIGSQIPNIQDVRIGVAEACRFYAELVTEGAPMGYLDLGGGLAVDYDGSRSNFPCSRNYTLDEYCADIIEIIMATLDEKSIAHPIIITESGRATVAYCSVLLFNILDVSKLEMCEIPEKLPDNANEMLINLLDVHKSLNLKNIQECYNDACYYKEILQNFFRNGQISLRDRALGETIFWNIVQQIAKDVKKLKQIPIELVGIDTTLADIYYCNFSVFQSIHDSWAIDQLFPIMPIHRLAQCPTRLAILADITCDSDGRIDKFIDLQDVCHTINLHELVPSEEYYVGIFLVGAYQETLGDLHNLFGDTNVVTIKINEDGGFDFMSELEGNTVADVLSYVEYDPKTLLIQLRESAEQAVREGKITGTERRQIMEAFEEGLRGYTYFER